MLPLIGYNILESINILSNGIKMFRSYIKTGLVIYPPNLKKKKYDKNSSIAYNYMKKYNRKH